MPIWNDKLLNKIKSFSESIQIRTRHRIGQLLLRPRVLGEDQRQIVDGMLVRLIGLVVLQRAHQLLLVDVEAMHIEVERKQVVQHLLQQHRLLVTVAADVQLKKKRERTIMANVYI